jgi:hypothetical protein
MNDNPWRRLPARPPFVLPDEEAAVRAFNAQKSENHKLRIDDLLPEPFVGALNAPVVILGNNPGFNAKNAHYRQEPGFVARMRANLLHQPSDYPFVYFAPDIQGPHRRWWERKLKELLEHFVSSARFQRAEALARSILVVEHFPYPSRRYGRGLPSLPSQDYSFSLVREAMERKAVIVLIRGERRWLRAVPTLLGYKRFCTVKSYQTGSISSKNCDRFQEVVRAIEKHLRREKK